MYNNINSKALDVRKRNVLFVFLLVISMFIMVACESKEEQVTTQEFELVSCYIEHKSKTNGFGGVLRTDEYLHYGYVDDGQVIFDARLLGNYIDFQITEGTSKLIITTGPGYTNYAFQLTREMYNNLNSSQ